MKNSKNHRTFDFLRGNILVRNTSRLIATLCMLTVLLALQSCNQNEDHDPRDEGIEEQIVQHEDFEAYLVELENQTGADVPQNPKLLHKKDKGESTLRGCATDCDYNMDDCLTCDPPVSYSQSVNIGGCVVNFSFDLLRCEDYNGELVYNQILNFTWWPDPGCAHFGINAGYDINFTGGSKTTHDQNNNLVTGYILNHIEENIIYPLLAAEGATAWLGEIKTVVTKNCYAYCDGDQEYKECGEGCCMRSTLFDVNNGTVTSETTTNLSNSVLGTCRNNPLTFSCSTVANCEEELDCDIDTFN